MKIALMHFRVYETDGVSLEMNKWRLSFDKMNHETLYISGSKPKSNDIYIKELDYRSKYNKIIHQNAFVKLTDFKDKQGLLDFIEEYSMKIYNKLKRIIIEEEIDILVPNNISSLGFNLPVGLATARLAKDNIVTIIYHHHDFHWERERYSTPLFKEIEYYLDEYFPYSDNAKHCVINHIAQEELYKRKGVKATVVPNVFDFLQDLWVKDDYNHDLRNKLGIKQNDIVFLQATRIVARKAIELAYRVLEEVNNLLPKYIGKSLYNGEIVGKDSTIHFVLAGLNELPEDKFGYLDSLLHSGNIEIHYINDIVDHSRNEKANKKIYSLWDIYTIADFITFTSILEGWGNQLLEGLFAKKPMLIYEYPVFKTDIKKYDFGLITIDTKLERDCTTKLYSIDKNLSIVKAKQVLNFLFDKKMYEEEVDNNFIKAKGNLSYQNLFQILENITKNIY